MSEAVIPWRVRWRSLSLFASLIVLALLLVPFVRWAAVDAVWSGDAEGCRAAAGACWASVRLRLEFLMFGFYPPEERWRPIVGLLASGLALMLIYFVPAIGGSLKRVYLVILFAFLFSVGLLAGDGIFLEQVPSRLWTGFSLTVVLAFGGMALALPAGILLAFGRQFGSNLVSASCSAFIEVMRALPAIVIMFAVLVTGPYLLPAVIGESIFMRVLLGFALAMTAFYAEAVRGALMTFDRGQVEAASSLALRPWRIHTVIVLPQIVTLSFPAMMNINLMVFKDTVLTLTFGYYELLGTANASINTQEWSSFAIEMFLIVYVLFFVSGLVISAVGEKIEQNRRLRMS